MFAKIQRESIPFYGLEWEILTVETRVPLCIGNIANSWLAALI